MGHSTLDGKSLKAISSKDVVRNKYGVVIKGQEGTMFDREKQMYINAKVDLGKRSMSFTGYEDKAVGFGSDNPVVSAAKRGRYHLEGKLKYATKKGKPVPDEARDAHAYRSTTAAP